MNKCCANVMLVVHSSTYPGNMFTAAVVNVLYCRLIGFISGMVRSNKVDCMSHLVHENKHNAWTDVYVCSCILVC